MGYYFSFQGVSTIRRGHQYINGHRRIAAVYAGGIQAVIKGVFYRETIAATQYIGHHYPDTIFIQIEEL